MAFRLQLASLLEGKDSVYCGRDFGSIERVQRVLHTLALLDAWEGMVDRGCVKSIKRAEHRWESFNMAEGRQRNRQSSLSFCFHMSSLLSPKPYFTKDAAVLGG